MADPLPVDVLRSVGSHPGRAPKDWTPGRCLLSGSASRLDSLTGLGRKLNPPSCGDRDHVQTSEPVAIENQGFLHLDCVNIGAPTIALSRTAKVRGRTPRSSQTNQSSERK